MMSSKVLLLMVVSVYAIHKQPSFWAEYSKVFEAPAKSFLGEYEEYFFDQVVDHT